MSIVDQRVLPIGIPPYFVADALARGVSAAQLLSWAPGSLLSEYARAHGYTFEWGHIIEEPVGTPASGCIRWRVTPLRLWYETDKVRRASPLTIAHLIPRLHGAVTEMVNAVLPGGVFLLGGNRQSPSPSYHLFALLAMGEGIHTHRLWLEQEFTPRYLPAVFSRLKMEIARSYASGDSVPPLPRAHSSREASLRRRRYYDPLTRRGPAPRVPTDP